MSVHRTTTPSLAGRWTYRSYHNDPALVGNNPQKALALIFGEGTMQLAVSAQGAITGRFDVGGGYLMAMPGTEPPSAGRAAAYRDARHRPRGHADGGMDLRLPGIFRADLAERRASGSRRGRHHDPCGATQWRAGRRHRLDHHG